MNIQKTSLEIEALRGLVYNKHSDTYGFCPKVLSSLRPVKTIKYDQQRHDEGGSSCQRKQHVMDVTCGD